MRSLKRNLLWSLMTATRYRPRAQIETDRPSILFLPNPLNSLDRSHDILGTSFHLKSSLLITFSTFDVPAVTVSANIRSDRISSTAETTYPPLGETVWYRQREIGGDSIVAAVKSLGKLEVVAGSI